MFSCEMTNGQTQCSFFFVFFMLCMLNMNSVFKVPSTHSPDILLPGVSEREQCLHPGRSGRPHQRPAARAARGRAARPRPGAQRLPQAAHLQERRVVALSAYTLPRQQPATLHSVGHVS